MARRSWVAGGIVGLLVLAAGPGALAAGARCSVVGDLNGDGAADAADLAILLGAWGTADAAADLDGDGSVSAADLGLLLGGWGGYACGTFPEAWINGADCRSEPAIQVHQYNDNTFILRQSLCTNFEGPFLYLLFGDDIVLLEDTGASGGLTVGETVYGIIERWLVDHGKSSIELVVAHSHAHGDHVAGDSQFVGQPNTTVVGLGQAAVAAFFGIDDWPQQIVEYDLGGRVLDVIAIPGHHPAHLAFYDRQTRLLLTGDTLYPGRLYISSFSQYLASISRLVDFVETHPIVWILGTHVEMTNEPGVQFPFGSTVHLNEHPLQLAPPILDELFEAVRDMQAAPFIEVHDEFVVFPL